MLNRSEKMDIAARIDNAVGALAPQASVWEMNHTDLKAVNDFGREQVRPATRTANLALSGGGFSYSFPKHSLTILRLKVQ